MKALSHVAARVLEQLTAGLSPEDARRVHHLDGHRPFVVQCLARTTAGTLFRIGHYYPESPSELVPDPEMEFLRSLAGAWYPISVTHGILGVHQQAADLQNGHVTSCRASVQAALAVFAADWLTRPHEAL